MTVGLSWPNCSAIIRYYKGALIDFSAVGVGR